MNLAVDDYDAALHLLADAVSAFCEGDIETGNQLLSALDTDAIDRDREALRAFARTATPPGKPPTSERVSKTVSRSTQEAVQRRDHYHCRFTGRRLVEPRIFHEVARISNLFHFDEHHSVRDTRRGPAGHPMVRSHAAAYEHVEPHSCGGTSDAGNIVHTSVQLNESKGANILPQVPVPEDTWNGLIEYLPALRRQASAAPESVTSPMLAAKPTRRIPVRPSVPKQPRETVVAKIRSAASGLDVTVFASSDDPDAETNFRRLRSTARNSYFATEKPDRSWGIHVQRCSALDFNGDQKLTVRPKVCAASPRDLREWAKWFGVVTAGCKRCGTSK